MTFSGNNSDRALRAPKRTSHLSLLRYSASIYGNHHVRWDSQVIGALYRNLAQDCVSGATLDPPANRLGTCSRSGGQIGRVSPGPIMFASAPSDRPASLGCWGPTQPATQQMSNHLSPRHFHICSSSDNLAASIRGHHWNSRQGKRENKIGDCVHPRVQICVGFPNGRLVLEFGQFGGRLFAKAKAEARTHFVAWPPPPPPPAAAAATTSWL